MSPQGDIYLVTGHTDMRKSIDGLSLIVSEVLELNPLSSAWFIFCNRQRDKIKILFWDTNGFWLLSIGTLIDPPICGVLDPLKTVFFVLKQSDYFLLCAPRPV